jgi:hypothetical protein
MLIELNGISEVVMFLKKNQSARGLPNFPKVFKDIYTWAESLKKGCKCKQAVKLKILKNMFSTISCLSEEEKQAMSEIFPDGFLIKNGNDILLQV